MKTILKFVVMPALLGLLLIGCKEETYEVEIDKAALLEQYAPQLKFHSGEKYYPSSVEWAFDYLVRVQFEGKYWLITKKILDVPDIGDANYDDHRNFFIGNLASANTYAFWVERPLVEDGVVDLVYFFYYPWNWGKEIESVYGIIPLSTVFGNHVSDWENLVVRLKKEGDAYKPYKVIYSYHQWTVWFYWEYVGKTADGRPIAYVADGSHGLYMFPSEFKYGEAAGTDLIDYFDGKGVSWNTWEVLKTYDFTNKTGLGGAVWPNWMSANYSDPGVGDPANPAAGPIYRWGNNRSGSVAGYYRLEAGPTGPIAKPQLNDAVWDPKNPNE